MNKSKFGGVVGSSTNCQGAWEESFPPVHQVIGRQTLVWAAKPDKSRKLAPTPFSHGWGKPLEQLA